VNIRNDIGQTSSAAAFPAGHGKASYSNLSLPSPEAFFAGVPGINVTPCDQVRKNTNQMTPRIRHGKAG